MKIIKSFDKFNNNEIIKEGVGEYRDEFNLDYVLRSIGNETSNIIEKTSERLIIDVTNVSTKQFFGSRFWSMCNNHVSWKNFLYDDGNKAFFVYDFTKNVNDKERMFAVVVKTSDIEHKIFRGVWYDNSIMDDAKKYCDSIGISELIEK